MDERELQAALAALMRAISGATATIKQVQQDWNELAKNPPEPIETEDLQQSVDELTKQVGRASDQVGLFKNDVQTARTSIVGVVGELDLLRSTSSSLNRAVGRVVDSMVVVDHSAEETAAESSSERLIATATASGQVTNAFDALEKQTSSLTAAFKTLHAQVTQNTTAEAAATETTAVNTEAVAAGTETVIDSTEAEQKLTASTGFVEKQIKKFGLTAEQTESVVASVKLQLRQLGSMALDAFTELTKQAFNLQARGISAASSMAGLSLDAIKAGMSLADYTAMLETNSAAVVRFSSFDEFRASLDTTTDSLKQLGVFGPAANELAAAMRTTAVQVGIPVANMNSAAAAQVKVFEELRKTTMMTAQGFQELMTTVMSNEEVQAELLGMSPELRAARSAELTGAASLGQRMGLTKEASDKLTQAMLAQRKASVPERLKAAGQTRILGGLLGKSTEAEELARLQTANPATLSKEQKERQVQLEGMFQELTQQQINSGNLAVENIARTIQDQRSQGVQGQLGEAAATARLQGQAGPPKNADIGKETSPAMQAVGTGLTTLSGAMANPLGELAVTSVQMLAQSAMQLFFLKRIAANTAMSGMGIDSLGKKGKIAALPGGAKAPGGVGSLLKTGLGGLTGAFTGITSAVGTFASKMTSFSGIGDLLKTGGSALLAGAKAGASGIMAAGTGALKLLGKTGPLAFAFGFFEEMLTGSSAAFLGFSDDFSGRLMGAVVAGFNSIITGITRLVDDGLNWVMEGLGLGFRFNITKFVDLATSYITDGWKMITSVLMKGIAWLLESLPFVSKDAPWVKSLRENADAIDSSLVVSAQNREKLMATEGATMRSMGEEQLKAQKTVEGKSKDLSKKTADNVVMGIENLGAAAQSTARIMAEAKGGTETPVNQPKVVAEAVAMPTPVNQPKVVAPEEVNKEKAKTAEEKKTEVAATAAAGGTQGMQDLLLLTQQQLDVLRNMLTVLMEKPTTENSFAQLSRPLFPDNATMYANALQKF